MTGDFFKVQGSSSLYKNLDTGVVINTNEEEINIARKRKQIALDKIKKEEDMSQEISSLKNEIELLKGLIKESIAGK
jgi:hypothetical protein